MLVLSRKPLESVVIDDRITVTVVEIRKGRITLGIEAPRQVSIRRGELPTNQPGPRRLVLEVA